MGGDQAAYETRLYPSLQARDRHPFTKCSLVVPDVPTGAAPSLSPRFAGTSALGLSKQRLAALPPTCLYLPGDPRSSGSSDLTNSSRRRLRAARSPASSQVARRHRAAPARAARERASPSGKRALGSTARPLSRWKSGCCLRSHVSPQFPVPCFGTGKTLASSSS